MNAAQLRTSARLQRVFRLLSDGKPHSTRDIIRRARVCAVNSCIAELRENDIEIDGNWTENRRGRRVFVYTLKEAPKDA